MKATISIDGELVVSPESALEGYALKKWNDNYCTGDKSSVLIADYENKEDINLGEIK
jgi:hypothetical protein